MQSKILYVINHIDWFWSHRLPLARGAQERGYDVHVAVTGAGRDKKLVEAGFRGHELPPSDEGFLPITIIRTIVKIRQVLKVQKPDVVHAITIKYAFLTGLAALGLKDVRVVHTVAGLGYLFSGEGWKPKLLRLAVGPLLKLALKNSHTEIIFQNPDDMGLMVGRGFVKRSHAHLIVGSGVDVEAFKVVPLPTDNEPLVLMPTRLVHCKGISVFIEAAKICAERGVKARYAVAGGETRNNPLAISKAEMESMIEGSPVEWLGKVSDMPGLFQRASLICYPSYYGEGVPKVLLEACASGRAIVTTDHPGCREAVRDGYNGVLVPVKDAKTTADAVARLLSARALLIEYGDNARKRAEEEFAVSHIVAQTLDVYSKGQIRI